MILVPTKIMSPECAPIKGSDEAAGLDLRASDYGFIDPGERVLIPTGVKMALPKNTVGLIWPRSKLANKYGLAVLGGVIDSDYRGEIMVILLNTGDEVFDYKPGDRIAQLVVQPVYNIQPTFVDSLDDTVRGNDGVNSDDLRL